MSLNEPAPHLTIQTLESEHEVVLKLEGELDLASAPQLSDSIAAACRTPRRLVLDLSRLSFMDSSGLAVLARAASTAADARRQLHLRSPTARIRRLFELTGMLDGFEIE